MVLIILSLCIISCAIASAVYAKYVKDLDSNVNVNVIGYGDIEIEVVEKDDGTYSIKHDGGSDIPAYIRFAIVVNWKGAEGLWYIDPTDVECDVPDECAQLLSDGYYYCIYDGKPEIDVNEVISGIKVTTSSLPPIDGYEFHVQIIAEAIQCVPTSVVKNAWNAEFKNGSWVKLTP